MRKPRNITRQSAAFASAAERELAQLRKSLKAAEDKLAGLHRTLRVPAPKGGRRTIPGKRGNPSVFERAGISSLGNFFARGLLDEIGLGSGGFYASRTQMSSVWADILQLGQRIR